MAAQLLLDGNDWQIRNFWGQPDNWRSFVGVDCDGYGFIPASVPGEIHLDLERAGIILSHKRIRDATRITLKPDVIPPRQPSGQASRHKAIPVPANSSIDLTEASFPGSKEKSFLGTQFCLDL